MANRLYNKQTTPPKPAATGGKPQELHGTASPGMPEKTANWPGLPGPTQKKSRAEGYPTSGWIGQFSHKKTGL